MSTGAAGLALGIKAQTVRKRILQHKLPAVRTRGGHYRIERMVIEEVVRSGQVPRLV
jgi:excisionase family DNA binding protein